MKRLLFAFLSLLLAGAVYAQTNFSMPPPAGTIVVGVQVVASCGVGSLATTTPGYLTMDTTGKLCTGATLSASGLTITAASAVNINWIGASALNSGPLPITCVTGCTGGTVTAASAVNISWVGGSSISSGPLPVLDAQVLAAALAPVPAGTFVIGGTWLQATALGGWTKKILLAQSSPISVVKATAGQVGKVYCSNTGSSMAWLQTFDVTPITVGSTAPSQTYGIPGTNVGGFIMSVGDQYSTIIAVGAFTAAGATSVGATLDCNISYN